MPIFKKVVVTDKLEIEFVKVSRLTGKVTVRLSSDHGEFAQNERTFKQGEKYSYTLRVEDEVGSKI